MTKQFNPFETDWISPPGDTIADMLEELGWTQADFALRMGYSEKHVNQLIKGKAPITAETAFKLERVLGSSVSFWLKRETTYREKLIREIEEETCSKWGDWLEQLPVKELMDSGSITKRRYDSKNKPNLVRDLLRFLGVASPDEWNNFCVKMDSHFRRTREEQSNTQAIAVWLRLGEKKAAHLQVSSYNKSKFKKNLDEIRKLTVLPPEEFQQKLCALCVDAGVTLVLVPAIKNAHVSGVARWLSPQRPLIQLSLYGKANDRFWFTFFHEAAHILLHDKKQIFLDDLTGTESTKTIEREANDWARDFLIPPKDYEEQQKFLVDEGKITHFAENLGIHAGIVVGRLQYDEKLDYRSQLNRLKSRFDTDKEGNLISKQG